jgi:hypothetical protein
MTRDYDPLVKRLLDGEGTIADLPAELRAEGERALRILGLVDRSPVTLSSAIDGRVMARVREARSPWRRIRAWVLGSHDVAIRFSVRPWVLALGAAAVLTVVVWPGSRRAAAPELASASPRVYVRFTCYAPGAHRVTLIGTFNEWAADATPLAATGTTGVWTTTLALPVGEHQYAFLLDGQRWVADPTAPAVADGFGHRNSLIAVGREDGGGRAL